MNQTVEAEQEEDKGQMLGCSLTTLQMRYFRRFIMPVLIVL